MMIHNNTKTTMTVFNFASPGSGGRKLRVGEQWSGLDEPLKGHRGD